MIIAGQSWLDQHHIPVDLHKLLGKFVHSLSNQSSSILDNAITVLQSITTFLLDMVIIVILSIWFLIDGRRFIAFVLGLLPEGRRDHGWYFINRLNDVLGGYIRGQLLVAIMIGIMAGTGCYLLGVPYALLIGIVAFLCESIPVVGPVLASLPAIAISLFTQPFYKTLIVVGFFIAIQQLEQNFIGPRITGHAVGIHPVVAIVAVIVGLQIGGFWGAFLAVPAAGVIAVVVKEGYRYFILRQPLSSATVPQVEIPGISRGSPAEQTEETREPVDTSAR